MKVYFFNLASIALATITIWTVLFRMWSQLDRVFTVLLFSGAILSAVGLLLFAKWGRRFPGAQTRKSAIPFGATSAFSIFALVALFYFQRVF